MTQTSTLVQEALTRKTAGHTVGLCKKWAVLLVLFIAVLVHDLRQSGQVSGQGRAWWWVCFSLFLVSSVALVRLLLGFMVHLLTLTPLEVSDKQRSLLSITDADIGFQSATPKKACSTPVADKSVPLSSLFNATLRSPSPMSPATTPTSSWAPHNTTTSPLHTSLQSQGSAVSTSGLNLSTSSGSVPADSWIFHRNQSSMLDTSYNFIKSPQQLFSSQLWDPQTGLPRSPPAGPASPSPTGPPISDQASLTSYLQHHKEREKLRQIISHTENSASPSLWGYGGSPHLQLPDHTSSLRKNLYQAATKDTGQETNSADSKSDDPKTSTLSSSSVSKIWRNRNVTNEQLFQFTENMRIWMSANLLVPLVQDIDSTNKALRAAAPEIQIGCVGVDKLKKTAQNISGIKQLADVVPFLDVTVHQDYLVHRLRELSAGGAISAYRWNGGSQNFNGKPWKEEYPTDTAILLHLFVMYMDRQLPPDIQQPEGRTFSTTHLIRAPEKPPRPTTIPLLYLSQVNPPHLKVVLPPEEECEVGSGRNNFTHALLLFIHHVTHQQHSRIANINLTMSGVNLSWVVRAS